MDLTRKSLVAVEFSSCIRTLCPCVVLDSMHGYYERMQVCKTSAGLAAAHDGIQQIDIFSPSPCTMDNSITAQKLIAFAILQ